jgi:hypothetical protein
LANAQDIGLSPLGPCNCKSGMPKKLLILTLISGFVQHELYASGRIVACLSDCIASIYASLSCGFIQSAIGLRCFLLDQPQNQDDAAKKQ